MLTERLYYKDTYLKEFDAVIEEISQLENGNYAIKLNRTAFYPEGGGQPSDLGKINQLSVLAVQEAGADIVHILSSAPAEAKVTGIIDWKRRFDHMQQHTGQHILSAAAYSVLGAETVGFHLGSNSCQIDLSLDDLSLESSLEIEEAANRVIFSNLPIAIHFATKETISQFPVRKDPPGDLEHIRLIDIPGIDCCPCCGTHVKQTGEVGLIKIRSWERKKGLIRLDFVCGNRALKDYQNLTFTVNQLADKLSTPISELTEAFEKHLEKSAQMEKQCLSLMQELHQRTALELLASAEKHQNCSIITHIFNTESSKSVTEIAKNIIKEPATVALIAGIILNEQKVHLVFASSVDNRLNMGNLLKSILPMIEGKGGGNAQLAQGGGIKTENTAAALETAKQTILKLL